MRSAAPEQRAGAVACSEALLAQFAAFVESRTGLHFPRTRRADLERGLMRAAHEAGARDADAYVRGLLAQPPSRAQLERLAAHLTIGETYFFRDEAAFDCLERHVLPELLRARAAERRLRLWSAGCSSGEEPYSLAMAVSTALAATSGWNVSVLATDITPHALEKASRGVYDRWSFRTTPETLKQRFFRRVDERRLEVVPSIRSMVEFAYLNLAEDPFPSLDTGTNAMDLIFCRNVLMYFEPARAQEVLRKLERALAPGGWLLLSAVEIPQRLPAGLARVHFPSVIALRKQEGEAVAVAGLHPAPAAAVAEMPRPRRRNSPQRDVRRPVRAKRPEPARESPYARALRGYEAGDYAAALAELEQILSTAPQDASAMALLARVRANQGRLDEARDWCEKAISADKLDPGWPYLLATLELERECHGAAAEALRRALFLDPGYALAHFMLGNLARREGRAAEAERHFRNALAVVAVRAADETLPQSDGMTAGRLAQIIESTLAAGGEG